jgi:DMSO/TMAO reductase YedYZ molybdopterin-dependent catalytic subunit
MKKHLLWAGFLLGLGTSIPWMVLSYLGGSLAGLPVIPFDLFDWLARVLPAAVVNFGVASLVTIINALHLGPTASTAKLAEQSIAVVEFALAGGAFGLIVMAIGRGHPETARRAGFWSGAVFLGLMLAVEAFLGLPAPAGLLASLFWMALLFLGWGILLGEWARLSALPSEEATYSPSRRQFLAWVGGGSLFVALGGLGLARLLRSSSPVATGAELPVTGTPAATPLPLQVLASTSGPAASPALTVLDARIAPAPGTRPELTSNGQFYRVDINVGVPTTDVNTWRVSVEGLVDKPMQLSLDQLRAYPSISQAITLECISNPVGGDLISTGVFGGVPLKTVLDDAGIHPEATWINIEAFDGFYESLSRDEAYDPRTLLVYNMNGVPLPPQHGFPLRIYIPNHFGMKQPKWISNIRAANQQGPGYWVERGWSSTAIVQTTSVIDNVAVGARDTTTNSVPVGGIAYAGARGIQRVEVSVDGGPWKACELRVPPLSPLSWVQWRYAMPYQAGSHTLSVRATDGTGALQTSNNTDTFPDGATGLFTYQVLM